MRDDLKLAKQARALARRAIPGDSYEAISARVELAARVVRVLGPHADSAALGARIARIADDIDARHRNCPDAQRARRLANNLRVSDAGYTTFLAAFEAERKRIRAKGR
jgi:hypothetical protein